MPTRRATWLPLAAVVANGLLVGASLDQSIKQLPAPPPHRPGRNCRLQPAADLRNGIPWYAESSTGPAHPNRRADRKQPR